MATKKQIKRAIERDGSFRTLKMCVKYLDKVCDPRMRKATLEFLWSKFVGPMQP